MKTRQPQNLTPRDKTPKLARPLWLFLIWGLIIYIFLMRGYSEVREIPYTWFKKNVSQGNVAEIQVKGDIIQGLFKKPLERGEGEDAVAIKQFRTVLPPFEDEGLMTLLEKQDVVIHTESTQASWWGTLLISFLPWLLIIGFFIYSSRNLQRRMGGGAGIFKFGQSKAKRYQSEESTTTFQDVAGLSNAKKELEEIIDFLRNPSKFQKLGGKLPKGILLAGPPGTGKTLMARASAGEAEVPFFSISGSEFIEMFVGVGASRVRDMFSRAKKEAPAIIFIDEIDSIGRVRGAGLGGGHDEREQTLNQILSEMDGFLPHESVVVMAATNRPDVLDPALVRPGRFDRRITLEHPHRQARVEILKIHTRDVPLTDDIDLETLAAMSVGFSGADLENLVNEAALLAGRKDKETVENSDFEEGIDKIRMGLAREEVFSEDERKLIAYHESGHALLAKLLPGADPLKKVTIIPHGRALGATEQIPDEDRHNFSRKYLYNRIAILLGGRVAERLALDDISSGAGSDLKQATGLARRMVCQWGMSERIGPITFDRGEPHPFLGKEMAEQKNFSEDSARMIDEEIRNIVGGMEKQAEEIISANRSRLDALAKALLEHETLEDQEIDRLLNLA